MRYVRVKVKRDTNTVYSRTMPPWEIPVLEFIFEPGNVEQEEVFEKSNMPYPDAGIEFDRLVRVYGSDEKSGVPHVASVYGNAGLGVRALKREIDTAKAADAAAAKAERARLQRRPTLVEIEADPLLA